MSSSYGKYIEMTIFGESHGNGIGVVLNGLPSGMKISEDEILLQLSRRAPGKDASATKRKESDKPEFLSGLHNGLTTGAPFCAIIRNEDTHSGDYKDISACPRPSHADYAAHIKYGGFNDVRGGGHFSGRLTAPVVVAGSVCRQILSAYGITIGGHVLNIGGVCDDLFDPVNINEKLLKKLNQEYFSVISPAAKKNMATLIEKARLSADSVGGSVEIAITALPAGLGSPMFGGVENVLSEAIYGIPAVKAISFGSGFDFTSMYGSKSNDSIYVDDGKVKTRTNNCGGITGGITNGMPVILKAALKPTPSIGTEQATIDLVSGKPTTFTIKGRHDPCIVPRALPGIEAAVAVGIINLMAEAGKL